jgi:hypothetical protein
MKKKLRSQKSVAQLKKIAQTFFNAYIRRRDSENGWFTCISCGKTIRTQYMNAGHYAPVGRYGWARFDEFNCAGECQNCNLFNEFHLVGYRKNLVKKYGEKAVDDFDELCVNHPLKQWKREELLEIIRKYGGEEEYNKYV